MKIIYVVVHVLKSGDEDVPRFAFTNRADAEEFCHCLNAQLAVNPEDDDVVNPREFFAVVPFELDPSLEKSGKMLNEILRKNSE